MISLSTVAKAEVHFAMGSNSLLIPASDFRFFHPPHPR